jgi:protein-disulfide isomerase
MLRRLFLKSALAVTLAWAGTSAAVAGDTAPRVDVVKVMSLTCPVCRAAEAQDPAIERAVRDTGGRFVFAPVPTEEEASSGAKERVYYAARDLDANTAAAIKSSLYKGAQDMGVPLTDYLQVYTWLSQDLPQLDPKFVPLFDKAQAPAAGSALARAARLASQAGVSALPGYVILVDGQVTALLDPQSVPGNSLLKLRDEVIARVHKLSTR